MQGIPTTLQQTLLMISIKEIQKSEKTSKKSKSKIKIKNHWQNLTVLHENLQS